MIKLCAFSDEAADGLSGQIDALHRNDISLIEPRSIDGKNVSDFSEREAKEVFRVLDGEGISVWSIGSPLGKVDIAQTSLTDFIDRAKHICAVANALCADKVRAFSFFGAHACGEKAVEYLNRAAEVARSFGVTLCHENEKEVYGDTVARVAELMQKLDGWQFVYDPANFIQVGETAETFLPLAKKCLYFHIKDVIADSGELVPAGEGDGDIKGLISMIEGDTVLTVEPHLKVFSAYDRIDGTRLQSKYGYRTNAEAFDAAVSALKACLCGCGYKYIDGAYCYG